MVLPLVDEHKPKCYLCHEGFEDIEKLRAHQNTKHSDFVKSNEKQTKIQNIVISLNLMKNKRQENQHLAMSQYF